ncbi:unnamed protein product [Ceutorhynchus assimilis]|uniref:Uncharacterized protein n=1 Tax=Ceutorhynchus assimilis TaxID=467358 RepID=A0A9N9MGB1_9CUCU|nr:unnamed protein product [Ceutorhynchus assimilis]
MYRVKKIDLLEVWLHGADKVEKNRNVLSFVTEKFKNNKDILSGTMEKKINRLCINFEARWQAVSRRKDFFLKQNADWLKEDFILEVSEPLPSTSSAGRPRLFFSEQSPRTQRRTASKVSEEHKQDWALLVQAAVKAARQQKNKDVAIVLQEIVKSPTQPSKIKKLFSSSETPIIAYTAEEALELILDSRLSKQQYLDIRRGAIQKNCNIYPDYKKIWQIKSSCRPSGIQVTEVIAEVPLKNLLEHTTKRIINLQKDVILQFMDSLSMAEIDAEIIFSYGFDGSSGFSVYKQKFDSSDTQSDASLFATTIVPLRFQSMNIVLWNNRTPQSVRFCRPLKLEFVKETSEHILKEKIGLDLQIQQLDILRIELEPSKVIKITFQLFMTLIDGKVLNTLTGNKSSQSCPICKATPKSFLQIQPESFQRSEVYNPKPGTLQYGISPLHAWIRFFECIVHISYRYDLREWQIRGENNKKIFNARKKIVQDRFLKKLSLHVDKPKPNGFGSTNDGNTARRSFKDTRFFSEITDVNEKLINNFKNILICLSCQCEIDTEKFQEYCNETPKLYMSEYPWYPMPATVHKVLVHGKAILDNSILPVGYFGEEGSEGRNKLYKQDRQFHARKTSRKHNLEDIFSRALDTSDPIISSINLEKRIGHQTKLSYPAEVLSLLRAPKFIEKNVSEEQFEEENEKEEEKEEREQEEGEEEEGEEEEQKEGEEEEQKEGEKEQEDISKEDFFLQSNIPMLNQLSFLELDAEDDS